MALRSLVDGRLAVGAVDGVALLFADGKNVWEQPTAIADFRGQRHDQGIRLSATGDVLVFGYEQWGKRRALFFLPERTLTLNPDGYRGLTRPEEGPRAGLAVTDGVNSYTPKLQWPAPGAQ